jgi:hypothetical protein
MTADNNIISQNKKKVAIITGLFGDGIPSNCPLCVPEKLRNTRTKSLT